MKRGTLSVKPVSTFAGLVAPVAVLPLKPGAVSVTSKTTWDGSLTSNTLLPSNRRSTIHT